MALDGDAIAIANEAWSQLLHSTISNLPPTDMSREYYYTLPAKGFNRLQGTLRRLEIYRYKLGTDNIQAKLRHSQVVQGIEHIQDCIRSIKQSEVLVQGNDEQIKQGMEHIQDCIRSIKLSDLVQGNQEQNKQGIDHIQDCIRSIKLSELVQGNQEQDKQGIEHIQDCIRSIKLSESVQGYEEHNLLGIKHIQDCMRSSKHYKVMQSSKQENQRGMERIQESTGSNVLFKPAPAEHENHRSIHDIREMRLIKSESEKQLWTDYLQAQKMSTLFDELLKLVKNVDLDGAEELILRQEVLQVIKLLHHYGVDTIRRGVEEDLCENHKYENLLKDRTLRYKKKGLEVMLQICDTETCQGTIGEIIVKAEKNQVVFIG